MKTSFKKGDHVWAPHSENSPNILHHGTILEVKGSKALVQFEASLFEPAQRARILRSHLRKYPE